MRSCGVDVVSEWNARVLAGAAAAGLLIAACTDSHGGGGPKGSTETGNPPVIDIERVALVVSSDEVHVVGEPGAVTPGGGEVEVERLGSDEQWRGAVADDGAFDVQVEGSLDDTFVLRAIGDVMGEVSAPVYLYRGGATVGAEDGGVPVGAEDGGVFACGEYRETITGMFAEAVAASDRSCDSDDDCMQGPTPVNCAYWQCSGPVVSQSGASGLARIAGSIGSDLCDPARAAGCFDLSPVVDCSDPGPFACREGQCTDCIEEPCPPRGCEPCNTSTISWGDFVGAATADETHSITGCSTFTTTFGDGTSCTSDLPCTAAPPCENCSSSRGYSSAYLLAMLEHPDVVPVLDGATFGALTPGGAFFRVTIGQDTITISNTPCDEAADDCVDAPEGVRTLRRMLDDIAVQQPCPLPASACELPFDPGEGPGTIFVHAFHAQSGTCVPKVYTGVGGNANRFDDIASCRAACPTTATESGCPPDRTFVSELCLECGTGPGGCTETAPACVKLCTTADDCAGEPATCSGGGLCNANVCI